MVVFHGISRNRHFDPFQPFHRPQHGELHVGGERCADPIRIDQRRIQPFRLKEHLMSVAIGEPVDLVLDRWAIARTLPDNIATEQRRTMQVFANNCVALRIGPRDGAENLGVGAPGADSRHGPHIGIGGLFFQPHPIDRAPVQARRRACFEPSHRQFRIAKLLRKSVGTCLADAATHKPLLPPKHRTAEEGTRTQHHCVRPQLPPVGQHEATHPAAVQSESRSLARDQYEIVEPGQFMLDESLEQFAVRLNPRALHRAALGPIEHPIMDRRSIGGAPDQTVERIDFPHEVPLAQPADGRIAAHRTDGFQVEADQPDPHTHARCDRGCLATGMAATHDKNIETGHQTLPIGNRQCTDKFRGCST